MYDWRRLGDGSSREGSPATGSTGASAVRRAQQLAELLLAQPAVSHGTDLPSSLQLHGEQQHAASASPEASAAALQALVWEQKKAFSM